MFTRLIVPAAAVLMLASAPAMGRDDRRRESAPRSKSSSTAAIVKHEKATKATDAKALRTEGGTLCTSGKADEGVKKLEAAFADSASSPRCPSKRVLSSQT